MGLILPPGGGSVVSLFATVAARSPIDVLTFVAASGEENFIGVDGAGSIATILFDDSTVDDGSLTLSGLSALPSFPADYFDGGELIVENNIIDSSELAMPEGLASLSFSGTNTVSGIAPVGSAPGSITISSTGTLLSVVNTQGITSLSSSAVWNLNGQAWSEDAVESWLKAAWDFSPSPGAINVQITGGTAAAPKLNDITGVTISQGGLLYEVGDAVSVTADSNPGSFVFTGNVSVVGLGTGDIQAISVSSHSGYFAPGAGLTVNITTAAGMGATVTPSEPRVNTWINKITEAGGTVSSN